MKVCSKCGETKDESEFYTGLDQCKGCKREYNKQYRLKHRVVLREYYKSYIKSDSGKANLRKAQRKYAKTEAGEAVIKRSQKKYKQTEKGVLKMRRAERTPKRMARARLHSRTKSVIKTGELVKPTECPLCLSTKNIEAYHNSYDKPDSHLDVCFMCRKCHQDFHFTMNFTISS